MAEGSSVAYFNGNAYFWLIFHNFYALMKNIITAAVALAFFGLQATAQDINTYTLDFSTEVNNVNLKNNTFLMYFNKTAPYIKSVDSCMGIYTTIDNGMKVGSQYDYALIDFTLKDEYQIDASRVIFNIQRARDLISDFTVTVNGTITKTFTLATNEPEVCILDLDQPEKIVSLSMRAEKLAYVYVTTVTVEDQSVAQGPSTGVDTIEGAAEEVEYYDLQGRKLMAAPAGSIYLERVGDKVVKKI